MPQEDVVNRLIISIAVAALFVGCATQYQTRGLTGGFTETQLGEDIFQISFNGNAYTSQERATDFTLLRSAEVAVENGYRYFIIIDSQNYSKTGTYTTPATSHTTGSVYGYGNYGYGSATTTTYGGQTYVYSKPRSRNTIVVFKNKPTTSGSVYDAVFVVRSMRAKYQIRDGEKGR